MFAVMTERAPQGPRNWLKKFNKAIDIRPELLLNVCIGPITLIQAHIRSYVARKNYKKLRKAVIRIQCSWKRARAQKELEKRRQAAEVIRAFIRGFIARRQPESDVNRMFLRHLRARFLIRLASCLPRSFADNTWPIAPAACKEASQILRRIHRRIMVRNYLRSFTSDQISQLRWKLEASELFKGKKLSYLQSIGIPFRRNRLSDDLWKKLQTEFETTYLEAGEELVYCAPVVKYDRNGYRQRERIVLLTTSKLYLVNERFKVKETILFDAMMAVNVSSLDDGMLILRIPSSCQKKNKDGDLILNFGAFLIEFVSQLTFTSHNSKIFHCFRKPEIHHHIGEGKVGVIRFQQGAEEDQVLVSSNKSEKVLIVSRRGIK